MACQQLSHAVKDFAAFRSGHQSPFLKGGTSGGNGGVGLGLSRERKVADSFTGGRIVIGEGFAALRALPLSPDVILKFFGSGGHEAISYAWWYIIKKRHVSSVPHVCSTLLTRHFLREL